MKGELVGINTAIFSRSGGSVGIGFAIPANMVATVVAAAGQGGRPVRPWLGVTGQALSRELAEGFGLDRAGGVVLNQVHPKSPAATAGLELGDGVMSFSPSTITRCWTRRACVSASPLPRSAAMSV
jgi:serine protease Do